MLFATALCTVLVAAVASPALATPTASPTRPSPAILGPQGTSCTQAAAAAGTSQAICLLGPTKTTGRQTQSSPIWLPGWCYDKPQGQWYNERFDQCGILEWDWGVINLATGQTIGVFTLQEYHYSGTLPYSNGWIQQVGFDMIPRWGDTSNVQVATQGGCYWGTCRVEGNANLPAQALSSRPQFTYNFRMDLGPGAVAAAQTIIRYQLIKTGGPFAPSPIVSSVPWQARCDNNSEGTPGFGCVFPLNYVPFFDYSFGGPYSELAQHIYDAQQSGLPGAYPGTGPNSSPLTRVTDPSRRDQNRYIACEQPGYSAPPGKSCDEYPFASTWQGAAAGGGPRSSGWCNIPVSAGSGPYGWSVCMIDAGQNSAGGGVLGNWYVANRIISGDPFYIRIT